MTHQLRFGIMAGICGALATGVYAQSRAQPNNASPLPDLNPGEGWREHTPEPPKGGKTRAWSDPAAGCHLAMFTLPASETVGQGPVRASFDATLAEAKMAVGQHESGFLRITGVDIDGLASLSILDKPERSASLLACYWNDREPARCQAQCLRALQNRTRATE